MRSVFLIALALSVYGSFAKENAMPITIADFYFLAGILLIAIATCADEIVRAISKIGGPKP